MISRSGRLSFALAALVTVALHLPAFAEDVTPTTPKDNTHCDAATDITSIYTHARTSATVYHFSGDDALRIAGVLTHVFGNILNGGKATEVYVGIEATNDPVAEMFLYGADGCFVAYVDSFTGGPPITTSDMATFLRAIGLTVPFGDTFHQLPNMPGSQPGFSVGGTRA